jgi:TonB family protein
MLVFAFAAALAASSSEPWPDDCIEGAACDPRHAARFADPNDHEGSFALTNMSEVFSPDYYPVDALRNLQQGKVRVRVDVSPEGKPMNCAVIQSSHVSSLDAATCTRVMEAAKFKTARDRAGGAKAYKTKFRVAWILPKFDQFRDRRLRTVVPIDGGGRPGECQIEVDESKKIAPPPCPIQLVELGRKIITGAPSIEMIANRELVIEEGMLIGDAAQFAAIGRVDGQQLLMATGLTVVVDAAGKVRSCEVLAESTGPEPFAANMCKLHLEKRFMPLAKKDPNRQLRSAVYYFAGYFRKRSIAVPLIPL